MGSPSIGPTAHDETLAADVALIMDAARSPGAEAANFYETLIQAMEGLAAEIKAQGQTDPDDPALAVAYQYALRRVLEARARAASSRVGSPVQAIRVADPSLRPAFGVVSAVTDTWVKLFESVCETFDLSPILRPLEAGSGSFVTNAAVEGSALEVTRAFERLRALTLVDAGTNLGITSPPKPSTRGHTRICSKP